MENNKPNDYSFDWTKIGTIVALGSLIATIIGMAISSYYSDKNLDSMEIQRKTGLMPDVSIQSPFKYKLYIKKVNKNKIVLIGGYKSYSDSISLKNDLLNPVTFDNYEEHNKIYIELFNGSSAIAKNLKVSWYYYNNGTNEDLMRQIDGLKINENEKYRTIVYKGDTVRQSNSSGRITDVAFVKAGATASVLVPDDYSDLYTSFLVDGGARYFSYFSNIKLKVEFEDIEGKSFEKRFLIQPSMQNQADGFNEFSPTNAYVLSLLFEAKEIPIKDWLP